MLPIEWREQSECRYFSAARHCAKSGSDLLTGLTVTAALPLQKQLSTAKARKTDIVCFENVIKCKFEINKCGVRCGNAMSGFTEFPFFSRYIGCSLTRVQTCLERNGVERFR